MSLDDELIVKPLVGKYKASKPKVSEGEVFNSFRMIIENANEKSLNWAVNYARHGLTITDKSELRTQVLYVLNNMTRWRGPLASEVRAILKAYAGVK